jgi:hypothetical protein
MSQRSWNTPGRWPCKPSSRPKRLRSTQSGTSPEQALSPTLQAAFHAIGHKLPELWPTDVLSQVQRQALLRCLIDKVVLQRARRDQMHTRIVWHGGETTTLEVPVAVGALTDLVWSKNSCGLALIIFQQSSEPFATLNGTCTFWILADFRKEEHVALALMIALVKQMRHILRQRMAE